MPCVFESCDDLSALFPANTHYNQVRPALGSLGGAMRNGLNFVSSSSFGVLAVAAQIVAARVRASWRRRALLALPSLLVQAASWANYATAGFQLMDRVVAHSTGTGCLVWALRTDTLPRGTKAFVACSYVYAAVAYYLFGGLLYPRHADFIQASVHCVVSLAWFDSCVQCFTHRPAYAHLPGLQMNCACARCAAHAKEQEGEEETRQQQQKEASSSTV